MTNLLQEAGSTQAPEPKSSYINAKTLKPGEGVVLAVAATAMRVSDFPRKNKDGTTYTPSYLELTGRIVEPTTEAFEVGDEAVLPCSPFDLESLIANAGPQKGDVVAVLFKGLDGMRQHWGGVVRKAQPAPVVVAVDDVPPPREPPQDEDGVA